MKYVNLFESFIIENRNKDIYSLMRPFFDKTPEYVFKELYYTHNGFFKNEFIDLINQNADDEEIEDTFSEWIDLKWKKQIIEVNFNDFNEKTQIFMKDRKMGMLDLTDIPNDKERNNLHRDLATNDGKNEPVIITKTSEGYELLEGWHRTMSILSLGSDGTDNYEYWDKVKLNAWVGY